MIEPLDLNGPLTGGTVVLEASAGTGKTYALSHRVLREVGENGRAIDQILVVTFTRAAAAEIRRAAVGKGEVRVLVSTSARGAGDARARIHRAAEESRGGLEV